MTARLDDINEQRRQKLERLRARGINPYPHRYHRSHTTTQAIALVQQSEHGSTRKEEVSVAGRVMAKRKMGKSAFFDIRDGSGKIQLLFQDINHFDEKNLELYNDLDIGDIIGVQGNLLRTKSGEPTVWVGEFELLAKSLQPLIEKAHCGKIAHCGKLPSRMSLDTKKQIGLLNLRQQLDTAVQNEDYESAAKLRDKISENEK